MSDYREREHIRKEIKQRDSSISRKPKRAESLDRRPIINQEKPSKSSDKSIRERGKSQTDKITLEKHQKKKTTPHADYKIDKIIKEKDKKLKQNVGPAKIKRHDSGELKLDRERNFNGKENKEVRKSEREKNVKEKVKEKQLKDYHGVEEAGRRPKVWRDRTRTRTLSPTEIKQLLPSKTAYEFASGDLNHKSQEKDGSEKEKKIETGGGDEEYEDDFEDYDSDFEDDTESEKSSPPITPSIESQTPTPVIEDQWKSHVRKSEIETVMKSIEKENNELFERQPNEGFVVEDQWKSHVRKSEVEAVMKSIEKENNELFERQPNEGDFEKENITTEKSNSGLIDFSSASKKQKKTREAAASRKRGEELLNMITLDTVSYSILEIPPIPYEEFMKVFGKSNTKQVYVQTNEDNLDEEIQTDEILLSNKWTQNPPEYLGSLKTKNEVSYILTKEERLGVGGDIPMEEEVIVQPKTKALWNFLSWASQLVLSALEKKSGNFLSLENMPNHSKAMAFGDGFVNLNVSDIPFLKGRSVTNLCLLSKSMGKLLSVHINKQKLFQKCMICVWSLRELSKPLKVLLASNRVTSCCFGLNQGNLVFAGLFDGSVCLWDLRESSAFHTQMTNSPDWSLQSSTYTTAGILRESGHCCPVVAVRLLAKVESASAFGDFTPMQICSLDKDGTIIIWTVVQLEKVQRNAPADDLGLAHWGRVKLVKSSSFSIFNSLRNEIPGLYFTCNDILINEAEDDGFYIANSLGSVHHCSSYGSPMKPKFYVPSKQDDIIEATCLELCPFNGNYFLVGCSDGTVRLHSRHQENPLICLNANIVENEKEAPVVSLNWMRMRPCVFFALDSLSRINIWDLGVSDIYPEISLVLTEKKITCMRLLSISDPRQAPFIIIGTEGGSIEIHKLKKEYGCRTASDVQNEMKMFLKYVSIL